MGCRDLQNGKMPGVDKICAEVMGALDIKVSWQILFSNDTETSGTVVLAPEVRAAV